MKIEFIMIGALLFGLVFVTGYNVYGELLSNYDAEIDTSDTFGQMSFNVKELNEYSDNMRENIQGGAVTEGDAVDDMVEGGYSAIKDNPYGAVGIAANATETLMQESPFVPAEIKIFLLATLSILVTFAIIALIFRFEQR